MADETLSALAMRFGADTSAAEQALRQFSHFFQGIMKDMTEGARGRYKKNVVVDEAAAQVERMNQIHQDAVASQAEINAKFRQQVDVTSKAEFQRLEIMRNSGYSKLADQEIAAMHKRQDAEKALRNAERAENAGRLQEAQAWNQVYVEMTRSSAEQRNRALHDAMERARAAQRKADEQTLRDAQAVADAQYEIEAASRRKALLRRLSESGGTSHGIPLLSSFTPQIAEMQELGLTQHPAYRFLLEKDALEKKLQIVQFATREAMIEGEFERASELYKMEAEIKRQLQQTQHDKNLKSINDEVDARIAGNRRVVAQEKSDSDAAYAANIRRAQEFDKFRETDPRLRRAQIMRNTMQDPSDPTKGTYAEIGGRLEREVQFEQMLRTRFADQYKVLREQQAAAGEAAARALKNRDRDLYAAAIQAHRHFTEQIKGDSGQIRNAAGGARYAVMNLAYGVQDAATVFETSGFAGAIRASANNLTALGTIMGDAGAKAGDLRAAFDSPEVALIAFSTALMIGADAYARYQKAEAEFARQRRESMLIPKDIFAQQATAAGEQVRQAQRVQAVRDSDYETAVNAVRAQNELVDAKQAEIDKARQRSQEAERQAKKIEEQIRSENQARLDQEALVQGFREARPGETVGTEDESAFNARMAMLREQLEAAKENARAAKEAESGVTSELNKQVEVLEQMIDASEEARVANDKRLATDRKLTAWEQDQRDKIRFSDIAILQAEREVTNRQAQLKSVYDVPMAGMAQAGSQEAANIRARSMRREADAEKKELQEQLKVSREQLDELKAIREQMQPGYLVESFKP